MAGRPARPAMERVIRILALLSDRGAAGATADELCLVAEYGDADPRTQLGKEFKHLERLGWQIERTSLAGEEGRYRIVPGDSRFRLALTSEQQAELQRAALLADPGTLAARLGLPVESDRDDAVELHLRESAQTLTALDAAARRRCRVTFRYNGKPREVHPASVRHQSSRWYLTGREDGDDVVKHFVVSRMSDVQVGETGTADPVEAEPRLDLHPLQWRIDPPLEVTLRAPAEYVADVERWLLAPARASGDELTYVVTNRAAFRARLYQLGLRVEIAGPDELRAEVLAELAEMAGE